MFIGHYSVSLAARAAAPGLGLWAYVGAAQLLDILWCIFIAAGVEHVAPAPSVVEGLSFLSYPWSHSLAAALLWGALSALIARTAFRVPPREAGLLGLAVLSHWFLDLAVHRQDLPLWPGGSARLGLGLWDRPGLELGLEIGLFLAAGALMMLIVRRSGGRIWRLAAFLGLGTAFMLAMRQMPPPAQVDPVALGLTGLALYLGFVGLAWVADRPASGRRA